MVPNYKTKYDSEIIPSMLKEFGYKNIMQVPKIEKIVLNVGMGKATSEPKLLDACAKEMAKIAGQQPVLTKAKKSEANFKLRKGMIIGCMVTLRGERMYYFLEKMISVAFPRIRDFKGFPNKAYDGRGNYSLGIREQLIFPEINYSEVSEIHGMNITIVTSANTNQEAHSLLKYFGFPFRN